LGSWGDATFFRKSIHSSNVVMRALWIKRWFAVLVPHDVVDFSSSSSASSLIRLTFKSSMPYMVAGLQCVFDLL